MHSHPLQTQMHKCDLFRTTCCHLYVAHFGGGVVVVVVLGVESRVLYMLGKCSTSELSPGPFFFFLTQVYLGIGYY